jgi:hypothetical protein
MLDEIDVRQGPHPTTLAKQPKAFELTIIGNRPLQAVLTLANTDGTRTDIMLTQEDAFQIAMTLAAFGDMPEEHQVLQQYEEIEQEIPYGPH